MVSQRLVLNMLADAFLAGEVSVDAITQRTTVLLGRKFRWVRPLAKRFVTVAAGRARPKRSEVAKFIRQDRGFHRAWYKQLRPLRIQQWLQEPQPMRPIAAAANWKVPRIESTGELAKWLGVTFSELEWFAELRNFRYREELSAAAHYHYKFLTKRSGGVRLIEIPKSRIKELQRNILAEVLERVPPHQAAHGFVKGRSIKTFVAPHIGQRVVLKMDLSDFFPTFRAARIQTVFRMLGYPEAVADLLAGICTNAVPRHIWKSKPTEVGNTLWREAKESYARPHLPQGAATSPALANICCHRMDCRLAGLANVAGVNYTRYADDLAFSGGEEFSNRVERFADHVGAILLEEGLSVNFRKTRIMRQGVRQRLVGLTCNELANVGRKDFDRLKATLTNCVRHGPESQNREGHRHFQPHLEGRVNFVESINPEKAKRLRRIFEQISW